MEIITNVDKASFSAKIESLNATFAERFGKERLDAIKETK